LAAIDPASLVLKPRPGSGALGGAFVHLDVVTSTNDRARQLAGAGAPAGTVIVAEQQTAGRGRQGRTWSAPRGRSLTLSALLRPAPGTLALLPLATAVAVCEACEEVVGLRCEIKWPNDVLSDGRKLAGILIESRPREGWAVAGIGLNVNTREDEFGPELAAIATSLRIVKGEAVSRERVLDALLARLAERASGDGDVLTAYRKRDALAGRAVAWRDRERERTGKAAGIDDSGNLVVFADGGERLTLDAGEVHLLG
jgi:BirA family biotin operon repressor/biotin-[acetyl-CoA-carboxylase] ligase